MQRSATAFVAGMISALLLFALLTIIVAHVRSDCGIVAVLERLRIAQSACADDIIRVGFPIVFWEDGGFAYRSVFSASILLIDSSIALFVSIVAGWLWQRRAA